MIDLTLQIVHTASTMMMAGLIWFVQVVHYPLFARICEGSFVEFERQHVHRTGLVVGPLMLTEAASAAVIVALADAGPMRTLAVIGVGLLGLIWFSTWALQVPAHRRLEHGFDAQTVHWLVVSNWIRTLGWTARGGVAISLLVLAVSKP